MQRLIAGFLGLIFLTGCHSGAPDGIIAKEKMVSVLRDVHLADAYAGSLPMDSVKIVRNSLYAGIFKKYGTDSVGLRASIEYYSALPQEYDVIYTDVQQELQNLVDTVQKIETDKMKAIQRVDSIRNARIKDSLRRIARDSADYKLKKHLLYWTKADSSARPATWTKDSATADFLKNIGLPSLVHPPAIIKKPALKDIPDNSVPKPGMPLIRHRNKDSQLKPFRRVLPPIERKKT